MLSSRKAISKITGCWTMRIFGQVSAGRTAIVQCARNLAQAASQSKYGSWRGGHCSAAFGKGPLSLRRIELEGVCVAPRPTEPLRIPAPVNSPPAMFKCEFVVRLPPESRVMPAVWFKSPFTASVPESTLTLPLLTVPRPQRESFLRLLRLRKSRDAKSVERECREGFAGKGPGIPKKVIIALKRLEYYKIACCILKCMSRVSLGRR